MRYILLFRYLRHKTIVYALVFVSIIMISCGGSQASNRLLCKERQVDTVSINYLGKLKGSVLLINKNVDLKGSVCVIPQGISLNIKKGKTISHGTLKGNYTSLICQEKAFNYVSITGTWCVSNISTKLFDNLDYDNSLKDVLALSNPLMNNIIIVEEGKYSVSASQNREDCLKVVSNTQLYLDGTIQLKANDLKSCNIIKVEGENIVISGKGTIIGDKHSHIGIDGEAGMGINIMKSNNVIISGLNVRDCWGDCIYVGGGARNITIENCLLNHGRRQGISITRADSVKIAHCKISNVGGTDPQYAIDIEPNKNCVVDHIIIEDVQIDNCVGGIAVSKGASFFEEKRIGSVSISNCRVNTTKKYPIRMTNCENAVIKNCSVNARKVRSASILIDNVDTIRIENNEIRANPEYIRKIAKESKKGTGDLQYYIKCENSNNVILNNNLLTAENTQVSPGLIK